jgi:hypothetical protein
MSTPYSEIFDRFERQITDYDLFTMLDVDKQSNYKKILSNAVVHFDYACDSDLSDKDDTAETFTADLTDTEQLTVALYMAYEWSLPYVQNQDLLQQYITVSSLNIGSQSLQLAQVQKLNKLSKDRADGLKTKYSFRKKYNRLG